MATRQTTIDYILEQIAEAGDVFAKKMFGEYALYCDTKIVALVCDDQLFVKPTAAGKVLIGNTLEACPYPGAKPYFLIDDIDDGDWLSALIKISANELPLPKKKSSAKTKKACKIKSKKR